MPRGPDVVHRIRVPKAWLESGDVVEFELPRNLSCAACSGGGCDVCERSGAITLRGRQELPEILSVTLPIRKAEGDERSVVIRIPEQGGLPPDGQPLPRGILLLRIELAEAADPGVTRVTPVAALPLASRVAHSLRVPKLRSGQGHWLIAVAVFVLLAVLAVLAFRQHRALG